MTYRTVRRCTAALLLALATALMAAPQASAAPRFGGCAARQAAAKAKASDYLSYSNVVANAKAVNKKVKDPRKKVSFIEIAKVQRSADTALGHYREHRNYLVKNCGKKGMPVTPRA